MSRKLDPTDADGLVELAGGAILCVSSIGS
jgi:hypothetical protein